VLPDVEKSRLDGKSISKLFAGAVFYRVHCALEVLLAPEFLDSYVRKGANCALELPPVSRVLLPGQLCALSARTPIDHSNTAAILPTGIH
jgi:hypothetical protein